MNKTRRNSRGTSNTSNLSFDVHIPKWGEAISSKEEYIGMRKCRRKSNVEIKNEELKVKNSEVEEIKILKCIRKVHVETVNEEMKGSSSAEEDIGIHKCRKRIRVGIINKEVKGCTTSSKQQEYPPELTKTKDDIIL